jgi:dTDP-3-amino-3,4,6-trideoxy-alpha-D-glucose transaminase
MQIPGAQVLTVPRHVDARGALVSAEVMAALPFVPLRVFVVTSPLDTTAHEVVRGRHAHPTTRMAMMCAAGRVRVECDDGLGHTGAIELVPDGRILVLDPWIWATQRYSCRPPSALVCICSHVMDPADYIRDYAEFCRQARARVHSTDGRRARVLFADLQAVSAALEAPLASAMLRVVRSGAYVLGPEVARFEREWAAFCSDGVPAECVGVGSGLAALQLMLMAARIGAGDEVIVASNSYMATVLAVMHCGASPVFVEPDADTRVLDPQRVAAAVTPRTRAILACDLYGMPVDYAALRTVASSCGVRLFCDAAQSHGARFRGHTVGSPALCDATAFSFYPTKNLGAIGEAGAVVTGDAQLAEGVRRLRNYGRDRGRGPMDRAHPDGDDEFSMPGFNERMDPLQAAILSVKLAHLPAWNARRRGIAARYRAGLANLGPWLTLPETRADCEPVWHIFAIECDERDGLRAHLLRHGVETVVHYPVPPYRSRACSVLGPGLTGKVFPIADRLAARLVSLPCHPYLSDDAVDAVVQAVRSFAPAGRAKL